MCSWTDWAARESRMTPRWIKQRLQMGSKKANSILEAVWRIKDQLAAAEGYDVGRFFVHLRAWSVAHLQTCPVVRNVEELRRLATEESALAFKDKSPPTG